MNLLIKNASDIDSDIRRDIADIFVEATGKPLDFYSQTSEKLINAFRDAIIAEKFIIATEKPNRILGIIAISNGKERIFSFDKKKLREALGFYKGSLANYGLRSEFETPLVFPEGAGFIECIATRTSKRRKGIATQLITHCLETLPYSELWVRVGDTNSAGLRFFESCGFREQKREKDPNARQSNINEFIYMKNTVKE